MSERRLGTLDQGLTEISDTKGRPVRVSDLEIYNRIDLNVNIVSGDNSLSANGTDLDLDIHNTKTFGTDVDLDESGIDGFVELSETSNETDRTLLNIPEGVGEGTARNCAAKSNTGAKAL